MTLCPGKQGDSVFGAGWARDLATDIAAIREWGASAVVTLIEEHEFEMLGVPALPEAVRAAGIEWHHLPVKDVHAPDRPSSRRAGCMRVRGCASGCVAGERVLVHCRGGLGRAGSVAARLLVEFGATPSEAIAQVRAVRPGAIETREQERWVLRQQAVDEARDARSSRQLACLLGGCDRRCARVPGRVRFAGGDPAQAREEGIRLAAATGELEVSDDTQMTLFTLEGQVRAARDGVPLIDAIRQAYLDWYRTQHGRGTRATGAGAAGWCVTRCCGRRRRPGTTCLSALRAGGQGSVEKPINDSKGCGGVMRTAPLGFLGDGFTEADVYAHGVAAAALTHGHPDGYAPSGVMSLAVRKLLDGASWIEVVEAGLTCGAGAPGGDRYAAAAQRGRCGLKLDGGARASASFGRGWVGDEALAVGLHAAATATSFS